MAESSAQEAVLPSICTQCGLCCSGAVFAFAAVDEDEQPRLAELGFDLRPQGEEVVFPLPCKMLRGRLCSVYAERPHRCRKFRCALLKKHDLGEVTRDEALARIAEAQGLVAEVQALLDEGMTITDGRMEWKQELGLAHGGEADQPTPRERERLLKTTLLTLYIDRHFRLKGKRIMTGDEPDEAATEDKAKGGAPPG